jgi:hypothetical protein
MINIVQASKGIGVLSIAINLLSIFMFYVIKKGNFIAWAFMIFLICIPLLILQIVLLIIQNKSSKLNTKRIITFINVAIILCLLYFLYGYYTELSPKP